MGPKKIYFYFDFDPFRTIFGHFGAKTRGRLGCNRPKKGGFIGQNRVVNRSKKGVHMSKKGVNRSKKEKRRSIVQKRGLIGQKRV